MKKITLDVLGFEMELQGSFDELFAGINANLGYVYVIGVTLNAYEATDNVATRGQYVRSLIFQRTEIAENALHSLSCEFPQLDLLKFHVCIFDDNRNIINMDMTYTSIGILSIYASTSPFESILLMSVYCVDQGLSK